jgi:hypothetical protein
MPGGVKFAVIPSSRIPYPESNQARQRKLAAFQIAMLD